MGSFSVLHWIIVLFVMGIPLALIGSIVLLVTRASRRRAESAAMAVPPRTASSQRSVESRLQELDALKDKGLITDIEYGQQRASILRSL